MPDVEKTLLLYCRSGRRSKEAAEKLYSLVYGKYKSLSSKTTMETDKLTIRELTIPEARDVYRKYLKNDFPPDELRPLVMIERSLKKKQYICYGIFSEDEMYGYGFFAFSEQCASRVYLLDYFAVRKDLRDQGIGSFFLSSIKDMLSVPGPVLVEVENPDFADDGEEQRLQEKRVQFYLRNGFTDTGITAWLFYVEYKILVLSAEIALTKDECKKAYRAVYEQMIGTAVAKKMLQIHE